ncbi:MAG: MBL fold metallo-hydrolase [Desulfobacterales bacterium]|nr:MBL fold metallo-hydrolase [Desulfobacterales bacterium]MBF0397000.1 MBL fold metallo-hydrolase [Desulfobacterales bacterium]
MNIFLDIVQVQLSKMVTFSYIVGDKSSMNCALIDPAFDTKKLLDMIKKRGYGATHILNTHCHSDHTAGNAAVKSSTTAKLAIHFEDAKRLSAILNKAFSMILGGNSSPKPDILLKDGDIIQIGSISLQVIHTPGHTPGGVCFYTNGNLFTGDTLFVGGVGRTDLPGGSMSQLLKSIHEKIYTLPSDTIIWPGHNYGLFPYSTISDEKRSNPFTMKNQ